MMKTKRLVAIIAVLVLVLLVAGSALAMLSTNYRLDWYVTLSGGGGGPSSSASYAANFTVGQVAAGASSSTNHEAGLGYWYGAGSQYNIYLPIVLKNA
jgi:hypothetical protein